MQVAGWIHGGSLKPMHGAFAQYIPVDGDNLFRIPENVTFDAAATFAVGFQTAAMGLYQNLKLPLAFSSSSKSQLRLLRMDREFNCTRFPFP